jgi:monoamine oxidase
MAHTPLFRSFILALQKARRDNLEAAGKPLPLTREDALWTRRRFLGTAALAAGSVLGTDVLSRRGQTWSGESLKPAPAIAVIGGGIAGLNAAFQLQKAGYTATVYEARRRLGGRILSVRGALGEGLVTDLGGQLINTDHADMLALVEEFGLQLFDRTQDPALLSFPETGYFFDGRSRSEEEVADDLRLLAEQIAADAALLDQDFEQFAPLFDQRSVAQYQEDGFVHEVWTDRGFSVAWEDTQHQPDSQEAALTFFFGGDEVEAIQPGSARAQGRRMVQQLEQVIPGAQDASNDRFLRTRWAQSRFSRGSYTNFKPGQLTMFGGFLYVESEDPDERQDVHVGNLVFAGEHLSDAFYGFMNGAAQTGRLAAEVVLGRIQEQAETRARQAS